MRFARNPARRPGQRSCTGWYQSIKASDALPFDPEALNLEQASHAYDMIYQPTQTPFLKKAHEAGCRTSNGLGMLLYQGAAALEIWTGQAPPIETMRKALCRHLDTRS